MKTDQVSETIESIRVIDKSALFSTALDIEESIVGDSDIVTVEEVRGIRLSEDYKVFLKTWGQIETNGLSVVGMFRKKGSVRVVFADTSAQFFSEYYFDGTDKKNRTIVGITPDEEWFYVLDHESSIVTPFDPFSKKYVVDQAKPFCDFLLGIVVDELELVRELDEESSD